MKSLFGLVILIAIASCTPKETGPVAEAKAFQEELNLQFAKEEESPLTPEDLATFEGLEFFPVDTSFRVRAELTFHEDSQPFLMRTTTDRLPVYKLYATAEFTLKGKECSLEIYQSQDLVSDPEFSDYLFLPFTDKTNGKSTYGGGRYLDLSIPEGDKMIIDFNMAYNPYCAYNSEYSCPVPPSGNDLDLEVTAGVMAYGKH
jgi:uncharacterized protein (DUF1684 family)